MWAIVRMIRRPLFIFALLVIFLLKLRMIGQVIEYWDLSKVHTILYGVAYFMTLIALLCLFIYYAFIINTFPLYPRTSVVVPLLAMLLFAGSLAVDAVLFFVYHISLEANTLRTLVMRPVFYLGFIGLSIYILLPTKNKNVADPKTRSDNNKENKNEA